MTRRLDSADAADVAAVIRALDAKPTHVVGASYSAAVALTLATMAPELVRTVSVIEPPPSDDDDFRRLNDALLKRWQESGTEAALEHFAALLSGVTFWRKMAFRALKRSSALRTSRPMG